MHPVDQNRFHAQLSNVADYLVITGHDSDTTVANLLRNGKT